MEWRPQQRFWESLGLLLAVLHEPLTLEGIQQETFHLISSAFARALISSCVPLCAPVPPSLSQLDPGTSPCHQPVRSCSSYFQTNLHIFIPWSHLFISSHEGLTVAPVLPPHLCPSCFSIQLLCHKPITWLAKASHSPVYNCSGAWAWWPRL